MPTQDLRRTLAHSRQQFLDLAAHVERYPQFLPWWIAVRVHGREANVYYTDQIVGLGPLRRRFRTRTALQRPRRIDVTSTDCLFREFSLTWRFAPRLGGACEVSLEVEVAMRSKLVHELFGRALLRTTGPILSAFEKRAHLLDVTG